MPSSSSKDSSERERKRILHITFDGVLEPLGRSQVLSFLYGLSRQGFSFSLLSLERESDLLDSREVAALERELSDSGISWVRRPFHTGSIRSVLRNCFVAFRAARRAVQQDKIALVHARSYVPAVIGWMLNRLTGVPYVFDMRGYWVDELADDGRWFKSRIAYRVGKRIERLLVKNAAAIVTLTELQAADLRSVDLGNLHDKPIKTIPTCADYVEFAPHAASSGIVPEEVRTRLQGKLVVGLVGSINASYCVAQSLTLFNHLLKCRPDSHLLCLTRQTAALQVLLRERGIPEVAYTLKTARHEDMSEWLRHMHWGLLLLNTRFSKRGSMPTKLAEFFSSGVRPIQYGCNEEVSEKVREAGSGIVLESLSEEDLHKAALSVAGATLNSHATTRAREITRSHFSLEAGVDKYADLFDELIFDSKLCDRKL